jgi:myo-inositol-1(or 4)-monophosphatase
MDLSAELDGATGIAVVAGDLLLSYFGSDRVEVREKGSRDVVTAADVAAEKLVIDRIREAFPSDGLVAEEGGRVESQNGRVWYVDPLDGTMNYSRDIPIWCVSLGLLEDGRPIVGVIHDPIRGETFAAATGHGAWCNGRSIRCSGGRGLAQACVHVTIDFNQNSLLEGIDDVVALAPRVYRTRNIGSAALALAYVAAGRFDAMLHRFANAWDYAAGVALIEEAGGSVTDLHGAPFTEETCALVAAASSELRAELVDLVRARPSTRIE